jgi:glycosyltransferase involved in cell wall biosynthesis
VVRQPIEAFFAPRLRVAPARPPRILVAGPFEIDWKGVATALEAVALARSRGFACRLERLSQWPLTEAERQLLPPDTFHYGLEPPQVAGLLRRFDLLLAPSWEQEGFGLPALEAMASGVPVLASDVSCYRDFAAGGALLLPPRDADAWAKGLVDVLADRRRWRDLRRRGLAVAAEFGEEVAAAELEAAIEWVLAMDTVDAARPPIARPQGTSTIT